MDSPRTSLVVAAFAAIYVIWGSTYLAIKVAVETIPPLLMAGTRFIVAGVALWLLAPGDRAQRPTRRDWGWAFVLGSLMLLAGNGFLSIAEERMPSGIAALLITSVPLWMVAIDWATGGGRPKALAGVGLLLGFAGVALLAGEDGGWEGGQAQPLYVGLVLLGSFCWAVGSILARRKGIRLPILRSVALQMVAGGLVLTLAGLARGETRGLDLGAVSLASAAGWAYLVTFGAIVAYTAYGWLLTVRPPSMVSTYAFVNPVVAVALGALLLDEPLTGRTALASALIVGAVALVLWSKARQDRLAAQASAPPGTTAGPAE